MRSQLNDVTESWQKPMGLPVGVESTGTLLGPWCLLFWLFALSPWLPYGEWLFSTMMFLHRPKRNGAGTAMDRNFWNCETKTFSPLSCFSQAFGHSDESAREDFKHTPTWGPWLECLFPQTLSPWLFSASPSCLGSNTTFLIGLWRLPCSTMKPPLYPGTSQPLFFSFHW